MLDEERIRLMAHMTSYEGNEGNEDIVVSRYFKSDYVSLNILKTAACSTLAFLIGVGIYVLCNVEGFIEDFYHTDFMELARKVVSYYLVFLATYVVIAFIVYTYRYSKARRSVRIYQKALKRLLGMYEEF